MIHHFARALAIRESQHHKASVPASLPLVAANRTATATPLRIRRDPSDTRRTVIAGRFADVCAALDHMVEIEAAA